jgi:hypothetical protein
MDLNFSPDDGAFREAIRAFIRDHYPPEMRVANPYTGPRHKAGTIFTISRCAPTVTVMGIG